MNKAFIIADSLRREEARLGRMEIEKAERARPDGSGARPNPSLSAVPVREVAEVGDA